LYRKNGNGNVKTRKGSCQGPLLEQPRNPKGRGTDEKPRGRMKARLPKNSKAPGLRMEPKLVDGECDGGDVRFSRGRCDIFVVEVGRT